MDASKIKQAVKEYIFEQFLPGEDPGAVTNSTALVSGGILDSLATLEMVSHLEETYGIKIEAHEVSLDNMNTIDDIAAFVQSKLG